MEQQDGKRFLRESDKTVQTLITMRAIDAALPLSDPHRAYYQTFYSFFFFTGLLNYAHFSFQFSFFFCVSLSSTSLLLVIVTTEFLFIA